MVTNCPRCSADIERHTVKLPRTALRIVFSCARCGWRRFIKLDAVAAPAVARG